MSEVRLVVREFDRDWSGTIHASCADRAIAALSADPVSLDELAAATARFEAPTPQYRFLNLSPGLCDDPWDAGLVVIDLAARLVVVESSYSAPGRKGQVEYHDGRCCTHIPLRYHLADDWQFAWDALGWQHVAQERRRIRAAEPGSDPRTVFYGRPLLEFIAAKCLKAFANRDEIAAAVRADWTNEARLRLAKESGVSPEEIDPGLLTDEVITPKTWPGDEEYASPFYDTLSQIHADWLLTPRHDLNGASPREVAHQRLDHIDWDMQHRCEQWSRMNRCPPGLAESSHAFQYGGFGTHELVKYYDMVRMLLWSCWERLTEAAKSSQADLQLEALTAGDFLAIEVPRLESVREAWLDAPDSDCHGRTPRSVILRERARIPEAVSGEEAMIDADCPCCQMMADLPGPVFWHLDGCNQDDEFAFDIRHKTREEWEQERREWDERSRKFDAEWNERERLGVAESSRSEAGSVWSRSLPVGEAEAPVGIRVFGLGCRLAELIVGLRGGFERESVPPEAQRHIDLLNRRFGNLREVLQDSDTSRAAALIEPIVECFADDLDAVAKDRPELASQCESLADEVRRLLVPPEEIADEDEENLDYPY